LKPEIVTAILTAILDAFIQETPQIDGHNSVFPKPIRYIHSLFWMRKADKALNVPQLMLLAALGCRMEGDIKTWICVIRAG
jgi:hypothetical protein